MDNKIIIHDETEFDLHEQEPVAGTYSQMNGFPRRLVLAERKKATCIGNGQFDTE